MGTPGDQAPFPGMSIEGQLGIEMRGPMRRDCSSMPWALLLMLTGHRVTEGFQSPPTGRDGVTTVAPGGG